MITDSAFDRNGDKTENLDLDLSGYLNALVVAYVSPEISFLVNARYIGAIAPYYASTNYSTGINIIDGTTPSINGSVSGVGDLAVIPLVLTWFTSYGMRQHFKVNALQLQLVYNPGILQAKKDKKPEEIKTQN